jgi:streptomycin 6-kinase
MSIPQTYRDQPRWWGGGAEWLESLPLAIETQCRRWALSIDGPAQHGSNAMAIPVQRAGQPLMLRMFPPDPTAVSEIRALQFWDGRGTVRLIEADSEIAAMLLERAVPGTAASGLPIDEAMVVMGHMMRRLGVAPPDDAPSTGQIAATGAERLAADWDRLGRPFDAVMVEAAEQASSMLATSATDLAVNGDFHADQVLRATREPWLTVDPLLYRGDIDYDLARILWTRIDEMADDAEVIRHLRTVVEAADLDEGRARSWVLFRTVDYWLWALRTGLTEDPLRCARLLAAISH